MLKVVHDTETVNENSAGASLLDAIARDGAQQMLAAALRAEIDAPTSRPTRARSTRTVTGWWCATGITSHAR